MDPFAVLLGAGLAWGLVVVCGAAVLLNLIGLPANWLILILAALWGWCMPAAGMGTWYWAGMAALAVLGEILETGVQLLQGKKRGSSSAGAAAGMIGGIAGAILMAPFLFGIGAFLGALLGAWAGCLGMELLRGRPRAEAFNAAWGAVMGRFLGSLGKCAAGAAMVALTAHAILPDAPALMDGIVPMPPDPSVPAVPPVPPDPEGGEPLRTALLALGRLFS